MAKKGKRKKYGKEIWLCGFICLLAFVGCEKHTGKEDAVPPITKEEVAEEQEGCKEREDGQLQLEPLFLDAEELPSLDLDVEPEIVFDDRTLFLEDTIENEWEKMVYEYYAAEMAGDFAAQQALTGEGSALERSSKNGQKRFEEGKYDTEMTLHQLTAWSQEEWLKEHEGIDWIAVQDMAEEYDWTGFALVTAQVSWVSNEAALAAGPQLSDGCYVRHFVLASTKEEPEERLYEIFWDELRPKS